MKRKHVLALIFSLLTAGVILKISLAGSGDLSKVRLGFGGYAVTNGQPALVLFVTNKSRFLLTHPDPTLTLVTTGSDSNNVDISMPMKTTITICLGGSGVPNSQWAIFRFPKLSGIRPRSTHCLIVPIPAGTVNWKVKLSCHVIRLQDRLPYAFKRRLSGMGTDKRLAFDAALQGVVSQP